MKVVAIITVRTDSSRLPGKVLRPIYSEHNSIDIIYHRLRNCSRLNDIIIATSNNKNDDAIEILAKKKKYKIFRGSKNDVLSRIYQASQLYNADLTIRIPGDSPLIDLELIDWQIEKHIDLMVDYSANYLRRTFPYGLDVDAISKHALEYAEQNSKGYFLINRKKESFREHGFSSYVLFHPEEFKILSLEATGEYLAPNLRLVLDYEEDLKLIKQIGIRFGDKLLTICTSEMIHYLAKSNVKNININCINKWPSYIESENTPLSLKHIEYTQKWNK